MAYSGYLIKIKGIASSQTVSSDYIIPMSSIVFGSYKGTYSVLDDDSKRSGTGRLKRTTYPHKVAHCKFTLREMNNTQLYNILSAISDRYVKKRQRKVKASIWVPLLNDYVEDYFYWPDIEFTLLREERGTTLIYDATEVELIGY